MNEVGKGTFLDALIGCGMERSSVEALEGEERLVLSKQYWSWQTCGARRVDLEPDPSLGTATSFLSVGLSPGFTEKTFLGSIL